MIKKELLDRYFITSLEEFKKNFEGESLEATIEFYEMFLKITDYIPNKIVEAKVLGIECKDYSEELAARQYAREQINLLRK